MNIPRSLCCLLTWSLLLGLPLGCSKKQEASATSTAVSLTPASEEGPTPTWAGTSGRGSILQLPMDNAAKLVMLNIGRSYQMATVANGKPPRNAEDASLEPRNLKTKRDMQDREVEVVYGVDVKQLGE
ncbi:MAG TPA: hypothetical protein PKA06_06585, partial [Gemmatales bacterium]|nr:hypothetical protein [Gemmatales bacterium]